MSNLGNNNLQFAVDNLMEKYRKQGYGEIQHSFFGLDDYSVENSTEDNLVKVSEKNDTKYNLINVSTKYGDFCLSVCDYSFDTVWYSNPAGPYLSISLYRGHYDLNKYSECFLQMEQEKIWQHNYHQESDIDEWYFGSNYDNNGKIKSNIIREIYNRSLLNCDYGKKTLRENTPIYIIKNNLQQQYGIIYLDGTIMSKDNNCALPKNNFFDYKTHSDQYAWGCNSKAYFSDGNHWLEIVKFDYEIMIRLRAKKEMPTEYNEIKDLLNKINKKIINVSDLDKSIIQSRLLDVSFSIANKKQNPLFEETPLKRIFYDEIIEDKIKFSISTNKKFTLRDFKKLIGIISNYNIDESFKNFVINELRIYINLHQDKQFDALKNEYILKKYNYFQIVDEFKDECKIKDYIENLLESIVANYGISIEELLGNDSQEYTKKINLEKN